MSFYFVLFLCSLITVNCEYVTKKLCKEVNQSHCKINYVSVDPCSKGPRFCNIKTDKIYDIDVNFTPKFSAERLQYAIYGDFDNTYTFYNIIDSPRNACDAIDCPLRRTSLAHTANFKLKLDKKASGKFPVKVKFWNQDNADQVCCFTFNVKSDNFKANEI
ncbi:MD-2-related lipid-recognition protein-like [Galleria mellonella]|uniref:MD-2-related lipid-recognition protein-like n=1 Tax=Galleria mellonella TaxID=7137 RepID=A0A6J1WGM6_GALME|nr:MD-2-related lipid-recognition protein-like [Galleria mellonella]